MQVVELLLENSRSSYVELAEKLGVTDTAVRKRVEKLEREGIIKRYSIEIDAKKLGFEISAVTGVDTEPEKYIQVLNEIKKMDEVKRLYTSSGDHMIMAEGWFKDSNELTEFIEKIESTPGVKKTCPAIIHEKIK